MGLVSAPAFAGLFSTSVSPEDLRQIKHLAVVSTIGDTVHGRLAGLMIFQNKSFDAEVAGWGLDETVANDLVAKLVAGGKIDGQVAALFTSSAKKDEIIAEAKAKGFDSVLIVLPQANPQDQTIAPGITLLHRKALGLDRVHPCDVVAARLYRVSDEHQIGFATPDPCNYAKNTKIWHDTWAEFSDDEKKATLEALQEFTVGQLRSALVKMKLMDRP
jgi:hypothetical protein